MKGKNLGELEELIMLIVGSNPDKAYGVAIGEIMKKELGRSNNISAIHTVLRRLEDKNYLTSDMSESSNERGGRRKRLYELTSAGKEALLESAKVRNQYINKIAGLNWQI